ncbi:hypothetical protein V6N12_059147 [Hibiscus sabdariffa]|uniref:Uncharacterized protein n=1 Tax=Hibiscus sabdariffa TaxID=183260 RepID=A0ABR2EUA4_9ROSI
MDHAHCNSSQMQFLQAREIGYITWYENDSPRIGNNFLGLKCNLSEFPLSMSTVTLKINIFLCSDDVTSTIRISESTRLTFALLNLLSAFLLTFPNASGEFGQ